MQGGRLDLNAEDFFEVLAGQRCRTVWGGRDAGGHALRRLGEEFKVISSAKHKEQFRALVPLLRIFFSDLTREPLQYLIRSHFAFHL